MWTGEEYDDDGESSESLERPGLQRLLRDVDAGKVDRVIVHRLDRLSRDVRYCLTFLQTLRDRGVSLTVVTAPELAGTAEDTFMVNILASFAEFEHEMIRERLAESRAALKSRGRRVAGVVPYGYTRDPKTKQLVLVPKEAKRVAKLFEMAAQGMTPREIAQIANRRRWRTGSGGPWTPRQVLATLANPVYAGRIRDGDRTLPGIHQAIVSEVRFCEMRSAIQSRLTRKRDRTPPGIDWPLRGVLYCGRCGRVMSPSNSRHGNRIYRYYRCRSNAGGRPPCRDVAASAYELESFVLDIVCDPEAWEENGAISKLQREWLQKLADTLPLLNSQARRDVINQLVDRVTFDPDSSRLRVVLVPAGLADSNLHTKHVSP